MTKLNKQMVVVDQSTIFPHQQTERVSLFNPDGSPYVGAGSANLSPTQLARVVYVLGVPYTAPNPTFANISDQPIYWDSTPFHQNSYAPTQGDITLSEANEPLINQEGLYNIIVTGKVIPDTEGDTALLGRVQLTCWPLIETPLKNSGEFNSGDFFISSGAFYVGPDNWYDTPFPFTVGVQVKAYIQGGGTLTWGLDGNTQIQIQQIQRGDAHV